MKDDLLTALRSMDPADPEASAGSDRARRDLTTILATRRDEPAAGAAPAQAVPLRRPRRSRYLLSAAAAVVAVGVGLPAIAPGPAYAGWVAMPSPAPVPVARDAEEQCRQMWVDSGAYDPARAAIVDDPDLVDTSTPDPQTLRALLTEKRGPWTFTVMVGPEGQLGDCLQNHSWVPFSGRGSSGGSLSGIPATPAPQGADVDLAIGSALSGGSTMGPFQRDHQSMAYMYGRAGEDVRSVVLHTPEQGDVTASVQNGVWAAWWPQDEARYPEGTTATVVAADGTSREVDLDAAALDWTGG